MKNYKADFPLFTQNKIAYLDSAATSQKPSVVLKGIKQYYKDSNANPHRGLYALGLKATQAYEQAREKVAKFINAKNVEEIIFTKNASESSNLVAYSYGLDNLNPGDEILLSITEHHSCIVPWQYIAKKTGAVIRYLYINDDYQITEEELLSKINPRTKIISITHMSNVLGTINPIKKAIKLGHDVGAVVIIDVAQSIAHLPIDVQNLDADFVLFSGHKMMAPLGIGVLYGKQSLLDNMTPFLYGGDMVELVTEQETTYASAPSKFEAGTPNVEGAVGLDIAIDYLLTIGYSNISEIEHELLNYAKERLSTLPYVITYYPKENENHGAVISFNVKNIHPHDVSDILSSQGVCVRAGNHCAQPLLRYMGLQSTCRASFSIYNTKEDIDLLIVALEKVYSIFHKYIDRAEG